VALVKIGADFLARRISYRILGGYVMLLATMLLVLLLAISRLVSYSDSVTQSITHASPHIQLGSTVAQQIATVRLAVAKYLRTQAPVDYNEATNALKLLGDNIDNALDGLSDTAQIEALRQVKDSYVNYLNSFRNLVAVISRREQLYISLLSLQTAIETRLYQIPKIAFTNTNPDIAAIEASNQVIAHIQLASNEFTVLRLQPREDSVIWLHSELLQIQLWFDILTAHAGSLTGGAEDLFAQISERQTVFQQRAIEFMNLYEGDEQSARDGLEQGGTQLEHSSNIVLNQTLNALNSTVATLTVDASTSQRALLIMLVIASVASIIVSVVLTISLTRPLRQLAQVAQAITAGDLAIRARMNSKDEIGQLATAFDQMTDSLQRSLETERAANEQIRAQTAQIARQTQANAVMEERQRIARELHDSVKQQLFSISLSAGAALNLLTTDLDASRNYITHIKQAGREAQTEMKNLLQELVPAPLQGHRLEEALDRSLRSLCEVHNLHLDWVTHGVNTLSPSDEHALFRAAQEAIANVIRHSGASNLHVELTFGTETKLVVEDDGRGFDPGAVSPGSTGLAIMRARLERVRGKVELHTTQGKGTRIEMTINPEAMRIGESL
jgi:signal transduction histidine kinase